MSFTPQFASVFARTLLAVALVATPAACGKKEEPTPATYEEPSGSGASTTPAAGSELEPGGGTAKPEVGETWDAIVEAATLAADKQCLCPDPACLTPAFAEAKSLAEKMQALAQPDKLGAPPAEVGAQLQATMQRITRCLSDDAVQAWAKGGGPVGGQLVLVTEAAARAICACSDITCVTRIQSDFSTRASAAAGAGGDIDPQRLSAATEKMSACVAAMTR